MNVSFRNSFFVACLGAALGAGHGRSAAAESIDDADLQEVVVTASLRGGVAARAPVSVAVLGREQLAASGVQHLQDVLGLVPNLNWASGSSRPRYFQLRGIGETDQWQGAPNPSVGFLIDGIDFSGVGMPATLFDVEQVEVLRGPQGAIHGANALAGLINVRTRAAVANDERRLEVTAGDFATWSIGAAAGGALPGRAGAWFSEDDESAAWRVVAQHHSSDGFRRNAFLDRTDTNGYDETTLRARLALVRGEWRFDVSALGVDLDNGYDAFSLDNSRITLSDKPGVDAQRSVGLALRSEYDGASWFRFTGTTAAASSSIDYGFDGDWSFDPAYDFTSRFDREHRTLSQDLRFTSVTEAVDARWSWVAGVYALRVDERNDQLDLYNGSVFRVLASDYVATNVAAYGEAQRRLAPLWSLRAAVRFERRRADYRDSDGLVARPVDRMWGGQLSLERTLEAGVAYLALSRGFKAGGFNIGAVVPADRLEYQPEGLRSVELGWKGASPSRAMRWQVALFAMRRSDQQVSTSVQLDPGDPLSFIYLTDNAARGENNGAEIALQWQPSSAWRVDASLGLLRARFLAYRRDSADLAGREQAHAPSWQYSFGVERRFDAGWFARIDAQGTDRFYFSESHEQVSDPYTLLHLRAGWRRDAWQASLWVRNLFDTRYAQRGFFFGNEPPDFPNRLYVQRGDPRQWGVTVSREWP